MRLQLAAVVTIAAALGVAAEPVAAKTCKEPVTARARSQVAEPEAGRAKRATAKAISNWNVAARAKYGIAYRFWMRAENKSTDCKHTPKTTTCTVTATPCRLI